jgi:hypothetical protein
MICGRRVLRHIWMCIHPMTYNSKLTVRTGYERNFTTEELIKMFTLWTFHLYVATFQQHMHMRIMSACGSYHDFLDRGKLLSRNVLTKGLLVINMKSSLRKMYGRHRYGMSDHGYVPFVVITIMSFPYLSLCL